MSSLLILGAGGHGLVVADAALTMGGWSSICFLDDRAGQIGRPLDLEVIGACTDLPKFSAKFTNAAVAIGNARVRLEYLERCASLSMSLPVIIHAAATVSRFAKLGDGSVVFAQAAVNPATIAGRGCIINTGASVDHGCMLGDGVHISPGAHLGGDVTVGARTWVGIGASVRHGIEIGADVMVGAGAAVVAPVPSGVVVVGVPAKPKKSVR